MIAEYIIHRMGWSDVIYFHPGPIGFCGGMMPKCGWGRWVVGVLTGPDYDMICVRRCDTNPDAHRFASPTAPTIGTALLVALAKRARMFLGESVLPQLRHTAAREERIP